MKNNRFNSFEEMMLKKVEPLRKKYPLWERLDGNKDSGVKIFAWFEYKGELWRVNYDTRFSELEKAYKLIKNGVDPFVKKETRSGARPCLELIKEYAKKPKHLYIYFVKNV